MSMHFKFIKGEQKTLHGRDLKVEIFHVSEMSWTWSLQNPTGSVTVGFQLLLMLFPGEGEHGPTDCSHSLLLQRCSRLHQSCTQAFTSICTWELSESRIWSTIIPAQKTVGFWKEGIRSVSSTSETSPLHLKFQKKLWPHSVSSVLRLFKPSWEVHL